MPPWLAQLLPSIFVGVAVYVGIRVDLALAKHIAGQAHRTANEAHTRIDRLLESHQKH